MGNPSVIGYINEQPDVLRNALLNQETFVAPFVKIFTQKKIKKVFFFGSGTSYNVANIASYYFKNIVGIEAIAQYPTVFIHYEKADWTHSIANDQILFVGISQSGTSRSTIDVMKYAQQEGYSTLAITGNLNSEITKYVDTKVQLLVGDELTPPETKGYTVSVLSTYLWSIAVAKAIGVYSEERYMKEISETEKLLNQFEHVISESEMWYQRNKTMIVNSDRIYILGYGIDVGSALEAQLKIGEMLRLPTLAYEIEEYSHGPTMAISIAQTIFMIGSEEVEFERMLLFRETFLRYTSRVHLITCADVHASDKDIMFSEKPNKYLAPLVYAIPFQFVAAYGARDIGIDTSINPFEEPLAHLK